MSSTVATKSYKQQEVISQQYHLCLAVSEHQILGGKTLPYFGTRNRKDLVVEKGARSPEKRTTANGPSSVAQDPSGFFTIFAICHDLKNQSKPHVSEWFRQNGKFGQNMETVYQKQKCLRFQRVSIGNMR